MRGREAVRRESLDYRGGGHMARKRDKLIFKPMYKYNPAETKPAKTTPLWETVLRIVTLGLTGGERRGKHKAKEEEA